LSTGNIQTHDPIKRCFKPDLTDQELEQSPYTNTAFLRQPDKVKQKLIMEEDFHNVFFYAQDGLKINGLLRTVEHARANLIILVGWWPGKKEGNAAIIPMMPRDYTIMLLDVRHHGLSEGGSLWWHARHLGMHEYKDIVAAVEYLNTHTHKSTIIYGSCAGAFHAVHAALHIEQLGRAQELGLKGVIFDSGWASVKETSYETSTEYIKEYVPVPVVREVLIAIILGLRSAYLIGGLNRCEKQTNLYDKIHKLNTPIFYIHARNDKRARFEHVQTLAERTHNKICWWVDKSSHAFIYLKQKHEFRARIIDFCEQVIKE
jgi:pimeloyl-ACP methyl ester carboxylesterase